MREKKANLYQNGIQLDINYHVEVVKVALFFANHVC